MRRVTEVFKTGVFRRMSSASGVKALLQPAALARSAGAVGCLAWATYPSVLHRAEARGGSPDVALASSLDTRIEELAQKAQRTRDAWQTALREEGWTDDGAAGFGSFLGRLRRRFSPTAGNAYYGLRATAKEYLDAAMHAENCMRVAGETLTQPQRDKLHQACCDGNTLAMCARAALVCAAVEAAAIMSSQDVTGVLSAEDIMYIVTESRCEMMWSLTRFRARAAALAPGSVQEGLRADGVPDWLSSWLAGVTNGPLPSPTNERLLTSNVECMYW